ncbi:hypothetical protein STRTUCAR8_06389 [Streptomyces turgidiscabies Car8]|uniref:Uncharacterized protein n=1 Tax=Streptomyces turgidiscabies (strain Car8) TaxID=698760 RepID=L7F1J0_STRT8|nr:hypothetical protein STRTUCAR8_06389 [Streptomyces turgidiscabies Car8]
MLVPPHVVPQRPPEQQPFGLGDTVAVICSGFFGAGFVRGGLILTFVTRRHPSGSPLANRSLVNGRTVTPSSSPASCAAHAETDSF